MKSLVQFITEKLKISKSNRYNANIDSKVESAINKVLEEMRAENKMLMPSENFVKISENVKTPGVRFWTWDMFYHISTGKDSRYLGHNEKVKLKQKEGYIVVTDEDNNRLYGIHLENIFDCRLIDRIDEDVLIIIIDDDFHFILDRETYKEIIIKAYDDGLLKEGVSLFKRKVQITDDITVSSTNYVKMKDVQEILKSL